MALSREQIARYSRQLLLPEIGPTGQRRLQDATVLLIGAGGLGSPAALYLAAAGVGTIGIIDPELVEVSNLHRQVLYSSAELRQPKSQAAQQRLASLNPDCRILPFHNRFTVDNAHELVSAYDVVLDGSDNFPTRYLANDACVLAGVPLVHGAAIRFQGQLMTILPGQSPCLRCVFPEPPSADDMPTCQDAGIVGPVVGVIGTLMAQEAIKLITRAGAPLTGRLLTFDGAATRFREVPIRRAADCAVCGTRPTIRSLQDPAPRGEAAACAPSQPERRP